MITMIVEHIRSGNKNFLITRRLALMRYFGIAVMTMTSLLRIRNSMEATNGQRQFAEDRRPKAEAGVATVLRNAGVLSAGKDICLHMRSAPR